jgi:hypothetical protein
METDLVLAVGDVAICYWICWYYLVFDDDQQDFVWPRICSPVQARTPGPVQSPRPD